MLNWSWDQPTRGSGAEVPADEFYWDELKGWQPRTYRAALQLMDIALAGIRDGVDLAEHVVNGDGISMPKVVLGAFPEALNNAFGSMDRAYELARFAAETADTREESLQPLLTSIESSMQQINRIPALIVRANNRARYEGYQEGYFKGWEESLQHRGSLWGALRALVKEGGETAREAIREGGETARHLADKAAEVAEDTAPWIAVALLGLGLVLTRSTRR